MKLGIPRSGIVAIGKANKNKKLLRLKAADTPNARKTKSQIVFIKLAISRKSCKTLVTELIILLFFNNDRYLAVSTRLSILCGKFITSF